MTRTIRTKTIMAASLVLSGVLGTWASEARAQAVFETDPVYGPSPYAEAYKLKVRQRGYRERIVVRSVRAMPVPVFVAPPRVVEESRVYQPAPIVESRVYQPAPIVESRYVQPAPVLESHYVQPAPVLESRYVQPAPVLESRYVQPAPVVQRRVVVPSPVVQTNYVVAPY